MKGGWLGLRRRGRRLQSCLGRRGNTVFSQSFLYHSLARPLAWLGFGSGVWVCNIGTRTSVVYMGYFLFFPSFSLWFFGSHIQHYGILEIPEFSMYIACVTYSTIGLTGTREKSCAQIPQGGKEGR